MILHFKPDIYLSAQDGTFVDQRQCIEHPRLTRLHQRDARAGDDASVTAFHVEGVPHGFTNIDEALDYLRANPLPGDIVAIPPTEPNREVSRDDPS